MTSYFEKHYEYFPTPPNFLLDGLAYETVMGSLAYNANVSDLADTDLYGWAVPPLEYVYPLKAGLVMGFDELPAFAQYQVQHVDTPAGEVDLTVYNAVKYFKLCADGNPNMLDSLFTAEKFVTFSNWKGQLVRDNRKLFLSDRAVRKALGFASGELAAVKRSTNGRKTNRPTLVEKYGYDTKAAYHVLRLLLQAEYMCNHHDLVLDQNGSLLQRVRNGAFSLELFLEEANGLMAKVELLLPTSGLPRYNDKSRHEKLRNLLLVVLNEKGV